MRYALIASDVHSLFTCLLKGLDVRRVASLLGNTVQTVVDHYLPVSEALAQQAADILNRPVPAARRTLAPVQTDRRDSAESIKAWRN